MTKPSKNKNKLVSVVIPSYKNPDSLAEAINSALNQTYKDIEIIIVDDNNQESRYRKKTEKVMSRFNSSKITYLRHKKNKGGSAARNTGIKWASGEYIAFLDNDDKWDTTKIEKQIRRLSRKGSSWGGVYCGAKLVGHASRIVRGGKEGNLRKDLLLKKARILAGSTLLIRKNAVQEIGLFDESYERHQDIEFLIRFFRKFRIAYVNEVLVTIHTDTSTHKLNVNKLIKLKLKLLSDFKEDIEIYPKKIQNMIYYVNYYEICIWGIKERNYKITKLYYQKCRQLNKISIRDNLNLLLYIVEAYTHLNLRNMLRKESKGPKGKNILMIGPALNGKGGMSTVADTIYKSRQLINKQVIYVETSDDLNKIQKAIMLSKSIFTAIKYLRGKDTKIVHIHVATRISFTRKSIFVILASLFSKKIIMHIHGGNFDEYYRNSNKIWRCYINFIFNKTDIVIALTNIWKNRLQNIGIAEGKIEILPNPVSVPRINKYHKEKSILYLGKVSRNKGTFDLIKAMEFVKDKNLCLKIGGNGEIAEAKKLVHELKLNNRVKFLGWIKGNKKIEEFKKTMIYMLPSYHEGLPVSILEAMSYGIPTISTPVGGIPEIVKDMKSGLIVKVGDIKNLAKSIDMLSKNDRLRNKLGSEGYRFVKDNFQVAKICQKLNQIYNKIEKKNEK